MYFKKILIEILDVFLSGVRFEKAVGADAILQRLAPQEDILTMQWTRSNSIGLAKASCTHCQGLGMRLVHNGREAPCNCVFRAVFRTCFNRFREFAAEADHIGTVSLEFCRGRDGRRTYSRKREEYLADFCLVSRRVLDDYEHRIFRFHFVLGADWKLCCRQLQMDRGTFFHAVYRIEQRLGRVFAELEPYALYPLSEYFGGMIRKEPGRSSLAVQFQPRPVERVELPLSA
jgi:hypothetical protein